MLTDYCMQGVRVCVVMALMLSITGVRALAESAGPHDYFDALSARSDVVLAIPFRSQPEVDRYTSRRNQDVDYDPVEDAMRFTWPASRGSNIDQAQVSIEPPISDGTVFVTWEEKWSREWASKGNRGAINGINTFKNIQYSKQVAFESGGLQLELRKQHRKSFRTGRAVPKGKAGYVDIRSYFAAQGGPGGKRQYPGIKRDFLLNVETWARWYLYIDYAGVGKVTLWLAEPGRSPVAVYEQARGAEPGNPGVFRSFWFEHNSSQKYDGPTSHVWNRNLVVLNGVKDFAEAKALVEQGRF